MIVRVGAVNITENMCASLQQYTGENDSPSDSALMEQLKTGDMSALEEIYMRYKAMVKSAIYRVSPNVIAADAEELTQDIFIALVNAAPQFDSTKRLKPWLYGIAVNKTIDNKRSGWLHTDLLKKRSAEDPPVHPVHTDHLAENIHLRKQLNQAFELLPKEQHDVMVLHAVEGFKGHEIAEILQIEVNTVWTRLHRARKTLSKSLAAASGGRK
ncbi:MAG: RNA polymerase sigma factor [Deltaproteobacteria bacterium]|nr:RNA polymerase sigma factor [Deltaproteobacteria bacterium]MBN2672680.1 RNA polymerase sigma factor [Deltaproteobacteria bacterium]